MGIKNLQVRWTTDVLWSLKFPHTKQEKFTQIKWYRAININYFWGISPTPFHNYNAWSFEKKDNSWSEVARWLDNFEPQKGQEDGIWD